MADSSQWTLTVRCSSGKTFQWSGSRAASVAEFKEAIAGDAEVPADQQRLIYKGRALQNEQLLTFYDVEDGGTVHLLRAVGSAAPPAPAGGGATLANPAGGGGLDLFGGGGAGGGCCRRRTCSGG